MNRIEWLERRRLGIGSSDAGAVCGLSRFKTPLHVYFDKRGQLPPSDNRAMKWGNLLEGVVAAAYEEETGIGLLDPNGDIDANPRLTWQMATVDRFAADGSRIVELKTARMLDSTWGDAGTDQVPDEYLCQVQHQMAVTGHTLADLCVLVGGQELRIYTIQRSNAFIERMTAIESELWGMIQRAEQPAPNWTHPATADLLEIITAPKEGTEIELDLREEIAINEYKLACEKEKEARGLKEHYKEYLLRAMGNAETAKCGNCIVSHKRRTRKGYTVEPATYNDFRISKRKD